jgi:hypothetical protein
MTWVRKELRRNTSRRRRHTAKTVLEELSARRNMKYIQSILVCFAFRKYLKMKRDTMILMMEDSDSEGDEGGGESDSSEEEHYQLEVAGTERRRHRRLMLPLFALIASNISLWYRFDLPLDRILHPRWDLENFCK